MRLVLFIMVHTGLETTAPTKNSSAPKYLLESRGRNSDQCDSSVSKIPVCDFSYELVAERCRKHTTMTASKLERFTGYSLIHDKCKKVTNQAPVPRCATGILKGSKWISETSAFHSFNVPPECHAPK